MAKSKEQQTVPWLGKYPVLDEADHAGLEADAAVNEFRGGQPREEAEASAHGAYTRARALDAAAHHLLGVRAAHAAQDDDSAAAHAASYAAALRAAGHPEGGEPPQEVADRLKDPKARPKVYKYADHPADRMITVPQTAPVTSPDLAASLARLKAVRAKISG